MLLRCYRRSYSISWAKPTLMDTGSVWELTAYHTTFIWFSNSVNEYTLFDSLWCNNMVICQAVEQTLKFRSLNSVSPHTIFKNILGNYWWGKKEICCVITAAAGCEWINCFFLLLAYPDGNMLRNNRNGRVWVNKLFFFCYWLTQIVMYEGLLNRSNC